MSLTDYLAEIIQSGAYKMVISKPVFKAEQYKKITIEKKERFYQFAKYTEKQVFHENVSGEDVAGKCLEFLGERFHQLNAWSPEKEFAIQISKKGKVFFKSGSNQAACDPCAPVSHNRKKNYILEEGEVIEPLVDMGIFTKEGKVVRSMYDKYKQINRFIELIDDVIKQQNVTKLNVIDFGCGKSYLTFVVYYYLTAIRSIDVTMVGLDLKADVIEKCNAAAEKYGYRNLRFELGDIHGFPCPFDVDMVITLHACDTATDYALYNAVRWNAKMIFSVPCCQHEVNKQIKSADFSLFTRYGIIQERVSALITDAIRGNLLEYAGYKTQLLEFVDFEHTPKNILIRALLKPSNSEAAKKKAIEEAERVIREFHLNPTLYRLLVGAEEQ